MSLLLACLATFLVMVALIPVTREIAQRAGLVDRPDERKNHHGEVPLSGGIAMFLALSLMAWFSGYLQQPPNGVFFSAMGILLAVGILDDRHQLSARSRFAGQIVAVVLMVSVANVYVGQLGDLTGAGHGTSLNRWAAVFTAFAVVGVINSINMIDGLDGLAGGIVVVALGWLAVVAGLSGLESHLGLIALFMSVVGGFLVFNFRHPWRGKASVFMGDAGSMVLGFALAWFAVDLTQGRGRSFPPMSAVWIVGLPLLDTLSLMLRRTLQGRSPFKADRGHLHHLLIDAGYSPERAVWIMLGISALFGAFAVGAWQLGVPEHVLFYGALSVYALYFLATGRSGWLMRGLRRVRESGDEVAKREISRE